MPVELNPATTPSPESRVLEALSRVIDPESGLDVVAMGLVEGITVEPGSTASPEDGVIEVRLIMTSAACPMSDLIVEDAQDALAAALGSADRCSVRVVDEPPWHPRRMSPQARAAMGWDDDDLEDLGGTER